MTSNVVPSTTSNAEGPVNKLADVMTKSPVFWSMSNPLPYPKSQDPVNEEVYTSAVGTIS